MVSLQFFLGFLHAVKLARVIYLPSILIWEIKSTLLCALPLPSLLKSVQNLKKDAIYSFQEDISDSIMATSINNAKNGYTQETEEKFPSSSDSLLSLGEISLVRSYLKINWTNY